MRGQYSRGACAEYLIILHVRRDVQININYVTHRIYIYMYIILRAGHSADCWQTSYTARCNVSMAVVFNLCLLVRWQISIRYIYTRMRWRGRSPHTRRFLKIVRKWTHQRPLLAHIHVGLSKRRMHMTIIYGVYGHRVSHTIVSIYIYINTQTMTPNITPLSTQVTRPLPGRSAPPTHRPFVCRTIINVIYSRCTTLSFPLLIVVAATFLDEHYLQNNPNYVKMHIYAEAGLFTVCISKCWTKSCSHSIVHDGVERMYTCIRNWH